MQGIMRGRFLHLLLKSRVGGILCLYIGVRSLATLSRDIRTNPPLFLMRKIHRVGHLCVCFIRAGIFITHGVCTWELSFFGSFLSFFAQMHKLLKISQKTSRECDGAIVFHCSTRVEMGSFPILL